MLDTRIVAAIFSILGYYVWQLLSLGKRRPEMPPGPPTKPVIGNVHLLGSNGLFKVFQKWRLEYGPVFSVKIFTQDVVVLSSTQAVRDILDMKAGITNERPSQHIIQKVVWGDTHLLWTDGDTNTQAKATVYKHLMNSKTLDSWLPCVESEAIATLQNLLEAPDSVGAEARRFPGSIALALTYGKRAETYDKKDTSGFNLRQYAEVSESLIAMTEPGATLPMDIFPWLTRLPAFMQTWRSHAMHLKTEYEHMNGCLWPDLKRRMAEGRANDCWIAKAAEAAIAGTIPFSESFVMWQGMLVMEGGLDTLSSTLQAFILAMLNYPETILTARREIDSVTNGAERLPNLEDTDRMPFVRAIVLELLRWRPVVPLGVPHVAKEDIVYQGVLIPKNAMIIQDVYGIQHDPDLFEDAEAFDPHRFIKDPNGFKEGVSVDRFRNDNVFGAGKRLCPGRRLALNQLHSMISKILWAFDIDKVDAIPSPDDFTTGHIVHPKAFNALLTPRSAQHAAVIREAFLGEKEYYDRFSPF